MITKGSRSGKAARAGLIVGFYLTIFTLSFIASATTSYGQATGMQGDAAWNEDRIAGEHTASGERYDPESMTAASADLPFDSLVRIVRIDNGKTVVVRINDRTAGDEHILHLSDAAARHIGVTREQSTLIQLKPLSGASLRVLRPPGRISNNNSVRTAGSSIGDSAMDEELETVTAIFVEAPEIVNADKDSSFRYTLQIAVFTSRKSADTFSEGISESWISPVRVDGKAQYRVYFSQFNEESPARVAQKSLRRQGRDSFLRKI